MTERLGKLSRIQAAIEGASTVEDWTLPQVFPQSDTIAFDAGKTELFVVARDLGGTNFLVAGDKQDLMVFLTRKQADVERKAHGGYVAKTNMRDVLSLSKGMGVGMCFVLADGTIAECEGVFLQLPFSGKLHQADGDADIPF